ncbi:transposase [Salipiger marinus]|uniref:transposase n=1 Tax=Salipiger marinus TaxID=555512 RepID=UPI003633641D
MSQHMQRKHRWRSSQLSSRNVSRQRSSPSVNSRPYGTVICNLERRQITDLLPDREPTTVEAWLRRQPQIEVVARDRNGGYGGAITRVLPRAVQVADR